MKDDKAIQILTVLTVTMLTILPVLGFTPYWIESNVSTTRVGSYQFTLITPQKADMGTTIMLQAHLEYHYENGTQYPVNNATINFYIETGGFQEIGTNTTNPSGDATLDYIISATMTFKARYYVTVP
jgi:hypothetical protein